MERRGRTILLATDLSPGSPPLFALAAWLARPEDHVVALHVYTPGDYLELQQATGLALDDNLAALRAEMRYQAEEAGLSRGAFREEVVEGESVPEQILDAAGRLQADLIVMGTHRRRGWRWILMGSVAEAVLRCARVPVLVVPPAAQARDGEAVRAA